MKRFFSIREIGHDRSVNWGAVIAIAAFSSALASQTAKAADQLPADSASQPSVTAVAPRAAQSASGRVSSALDSTLMGGGYQFKGSGADDTASSARSAVDDKTADSLASAINSSAGGSKIKFQKTPDSSKESGLCSPGAPRSLGHCHTKTPHWTPASR